MREETKGLFLAVMLSIVIMFITNLFWPNKNEVENTENNKPENSIQITEQKNIKSEEKLSVDEAIKQDKRIDIKNNALEGSLRIKGSRFDNILLSKYKQNMDKNSPAVELLYPANTDNSYYAEFGWLSSSPNIKLPNSETIWRAKGTSLTPETPITLEWDNGQGIKFIRKISIDENYMFNINDIVENNSTKDIDLYPYGLITRQQTKEENKSNVVHEGFSGVLDSSLREEKFSNLKKGEKKEYKTTGGWVGFSDRYWFSAIILDRNSESKVQLQHSKNGLYQTDYVGQNLKISSGSATSHNIQFFAGAKEIKLLDAYTKKQKIDKFDLAVDFGWYYFLTKPFFYILDFLYNLIGNMGWAILCFAALLRLAMFPIANKSYESMSKMKKVQPKMQELQERYKEDKVKLQQEMMNLYRKEKINPASGCLPILVQIPVFFSLYKVLNIAIEIRHAPFIGWIKDLSAPDPLTISAITSLPIPSMIDIGLWPIIMGLTMYIQQKLHPAPTNKDQARVFALLPIMFTFMFGHFASGLVIYWTLSNILSIIQQKVIMRKVGV